MKDDEPMGTAGADAGCCETGDDHENDHYLPS